MPPILSALAQKRGDTNIGALHARSFTWRSPSLFWLFYSVVLRRGFQLATLRSWSEAFKELEIVVVRHELAVLPRQGSDGPN
jgi:hypothetical protein